MARTPITPLVVTFQNLTEDEQKIFLDLVDPQPEPAAQVKQTRKKRTTKSAKAESLQTVLTKPARTESNVLCVAQVPDIDVPCGEKEDALIHDPNGGYASYHLFEAPKAKKAGAQK